MEFFETSEKVVVYMNKKRLELLRFHFKKKTNSNTITTEMSPIRNMNHKRKYQLNRSQ